MKLNLKNITMNEIISYSKQKQSVKITIIDKVNKNELEEIGTCTYEINGAFII